MIDIHSKQFKMSLLIVAAVIVVIIIFAFFSSRYFNGKDQVSGGKETNLEKPKPLTQEQIQAALDAKAETGQTANSASANGKTETKKNSSPMTPEETQKALNNKANSSSSAKPLTQEELQKALNASAK